MNPADGESAVLQSGLTALGRYGLPSEVAATVAHLAGESGHYISGASIRRGRRLRRLSSLTRAAPRAV